MSKLLKKTFLLSLVFCLVFSSFTVSAADNTLTCSTAEAFYKIVSSQMVERNTNFEVVYYGKLSDIYNNNSKDSLNLLLDKVYAVDNPYIADDHDYLKAHLNSASLQIKSISNKFDSSIEISHTFIFTFSYLSTKAQETKVNKAVDNYIKSKKLFKKSDYQKVKAVHDYIVNITSYDYTYSKHSAYNTLIDNSSVCQGYSSTVYYMLTKLGVPVRTITGTAFNGESSELHSWNIVKLGNVWYNLDATWNDTSRSNKYFLASVSTFSDHFRNAEFQTKAFNKSFPMSKAAYSAKNDTGIKSITSKIKYTAVNSISTKNSSVSLSEGQTSTLSFILTPAKATDQTIFYTSSDSAIVTVNAKGKITAVSKGSAIIYACTPNGKQATCTVTVD